MNLQEYRKKYKIKGEEQPVGWLCIYQATEKLYPTQEPRHYATMLKFRLGGKKPINCGNKECNKTPI